MTTPINLLKPYTIDTTQKFVFANVEVTGNLLANNANISNTFTAGNVRTDHLLYANGSAYVFTTNAAGSNTQIQFNDANSFAGSANLTFDKTSNTLTVTNIVANGAGLTSLTGANITGFVPNANVANTAYSVAVANVTGLGNLATVNKDGNASNILYGNGVFASAPVTYGNSNVATYLQAYTGNITANIVTANYFVGNGANLTSLTGANVSGAVAYATTANSVAGANVSGQVANSLIATSVTGAAQPNITSVGILTSLEVSGNTVIGGNLIVNGTTTSINSTIVQIDDLAIVLANDASTSTQANGAGIIINGASANMLYINSTNSFTFSHKISADGSLLSNITGANITGFVPNANIANTAYSVSASNISGTINLANYATTANSVAVANVSGIGNIATINKDGNASNILYGNGVFASAPVTYSNSNVTAYLPTYTGNLSPGNLVVSTSANLGNIGNITITGGSNGYVLQTDGNGVLSWSDKAIITVGDLTFDSFTANGVQTAFTLSSTPMAKKYVTVHIDGINQLASTFALSTNTLTFVEAPIDGSIIEIKVSNPGAALSTTTTANTAATVTTNAQPNITSVGTLTGLNVSGDIIPSANITYNLGNSTNRFKDLYLSGNTIDLAGAKIQVDSTSGNINLTPAPTVSNPTPTAITVAATPPKYVTLVFPGAITTPFTGDNRYYPLSNIQINNLYGTLSTATSDTFAFSLLKNGTAVGNFTISANAHRISNTSMNVSMTATDYLTLNITGGTGGKDFKLDMGYTIV